MKALTIITSLLLAVGTFSAETIDRRKAFVVSDILPNITALTPESLDEDGSAKVRQYKSYNQSWYVEVYTLAENGSVKRDPQVFVYLPASDSYILQNPIRENKSTAKKSTAEENLAAGQDKLEQLIALGIAIPAAPTVELPLKVRPKEWHGKVLVDYAGLTDDVTPAGVNAVAISAILKDPDTDIQEEVFAIITVRKPKPLTEGGTPVALYVVDKLKVN